VRLPSLACSRIARVREGSRSFHGLQVPFGTYSRDFRHCLAFVSYGKVAPSPDPLGSGLDRRRPRGPTTDNLRPATRSLGTCQRLRHPPPIPSAAAARRELVPRSIGPPRTALWRHDGQPVHAHGRARRCVPPAITANGSRREHPNAPCGHPSARRWTIAASPDGPSLSTYTLICPAGRWRNVARGQS
jgi:hypothetical protein